MRVALDALRRVTRQPRRNESTPVVTDEGKPVNADGREETAELGCYGRNGVVAVRLVRLAEALEVGDDQPESAGHVWHDEAPTVPAFRHPVQQHHCGSCAGLDVVPGQPIDLHLHEAVHCARHLGILVGLRQSAAAGNEAGQ